MLSSFACHPEQSRGRLHPENLSSFRTCFQRDRDRIIHSSAFRRLKHKTQVFVAHEGDYYRTRLTHSIEVAQVARTIAKVLDLNTELAEAVALAHDLGHTPFGHTGEDALRRAMAPYGGFDHNAQTIRIVTRLEQHYAGFDGLNLTWETLEGIAKHNGPVTGDGGPLPYALAAANAEWDLELSSHAGAEAQIASVADDIAYTHHDLDDGLRAKLFTVDELMDLPLTSSVFAEVDRLYPGLDQTRRRHESLRRIFGLMVEDVVSVARERLDQAHLRTAEDIRALGCPVIGFSPSFWKLLKPVRDFLFYHMYRAPAVMAVRAEVSEVVDDLFRLFLAHPDRLPDEWRSRMEGNGDTGLARLVADYVAGMTDRFAIEEHARLLCRNPVSGLISRL